MVLLHKIKKLSSSGQSLIEVLVAIGLAAVILPALLTGFVISREGKASEGQRILAAGYLRETAEAVKSIRSEDWNAFAVNGTYHPVVSVGSWTFASGPETVDGFTKSVIIADVSRDGSGALVASGGTVDPSSKQVDLTVSWDTPQPQSVSSTIYLTRYLNNNSLIQTLKTDFDGGTKTNTQTTNTSGGEVKLVPSGTGFVASGDFESSTIDAGKLVAFNNLSWTSDTPANTDLKFQLAINSDNATWNYFGPDGTNTSYFTTPGQIPLPEIDGRYIRFKASLGSDGSATPVLDDVSINYSP